MNIKERGGIQNAVNPSTAENFKQKKIDFLLGNLDLADYPGNNHAYCM